MTAFYFDSRPLPSTCDCGLPFLTLLYFSFTFSVLGQAMQLTCLSSGLAVTFEISLAFMGILGKTSERGTMMAVLMVDE